MNHDSYWQTQLDKVAERSKYILQNNVWTDCKFIVGDENKKKEFNAHKLILSMASPVFEKMFKGGFSEENSDVEIVDIQPEAFGAMLDYIYSDEIEIQSFDQACELCYVANKYMIQNLLKRCTSYVLRDVNVLNACKGYEFAHLFDQKDLMDKCKEIIRKETSQVIALPSFLDIQLSTISMILDLDKLNATEFELFEAIENWTKAEFVKKGIVGEEYVEQQQEIYSKLIPKIRFLNMSAKGFADGPAMSSMLKSDESFSILLNLTSSSCPRPLPEGFSTQLRSSYISEKDKDLVFLKWPLSNFRREIVYANDECSLSFSCNKDIEIAGFMVIGQDTTTLAYHTHDHFYMENLEVYLHDWTNNAMHITSFNDKIEYTKIMNIFFKKPIQITHGRAYNIGVKMKQSGIYAGGVLNSMEQVHKSVKFTFLNTPFLKLICGVIFAFMNDD